MRAHESQLKISRATACGLGTQKEQIVGVQRSNIGVGREKAKAQALEYAIWLTVTNTVISGFKSLPLSWAKSEHRVRLNWD